MMNDARHLKLMILGSTGSVGSQACDVALACGYDVVSLSANSNVDAIEAQARRFMPASVCMTDPAAAADLAVRLADTGVSVFSGTEGLREMIMSSPADAAVNAVIGSAGLAPTLDIIGAGIPLALANKESLVIAGDLVMKRAADSAVRITPVDSEHSAIYQCLAAGRRDDVHRLILTASGGPFFRRKREELAAVTPQQALAHPTWKMGPSITVDSATLMNKGFEVIEASKLFGVPADRIDVLIHRESIVHSLVEFNDGAQIAQLSCPDMRLCIQYAIEAPARKTAVIPKLDLAAVGSLSFARPDTDTFIPLKLAFEALRAGGAAPAVLHAANEVAVGAFLRGKLSFTGIFDCLEQVTDKLSKSSVTDPLCLEDILSVSAEAAKEAEKFNN